MASVASEFLRIQNSSESNGMVVNDSTGLEFGPGKHQGKPRCMLSFGNTLNLSSRSRLNRQTEGFNGKSEGSSHAEIMELFPVSTGFSSNPRVTETNITVPFAIGLPDLNSSRSATAKAAEQPATAQLTIFYKGEMNVYDMSDEKAQAIMKFASTNSSNNSRLSRIRISSRKIEQIAQLQKPSKPALNTINENQPQEPPLDLEIVRDLSLKRFLQKRKERLNSVAPYTTKETATLRSKAEKDSDEQITLSLGYP